MNQIKESYGTEIININDVFQLKLVEGYYYKPQFIKEPNKSINGILFRDYREYDSWEIIWSLSDDRMDVGVTINNRNSIKQLIEQQIENNKTK